MTTATFDPGATAPFSSNESVSARFDLFPAEVAFFMPGNVIEYPKCRVIITGDGTYVFSDGPRGPVLLYYDRMDDIFGALSTGFRIIPASTLADITHVEVRPTTRCGCGSRLRGFRPFSNLNHMPTTAFPPLEPIPA